jgi:(p)ppGpp synthase/HD superfamily hydrolase
MTANKRADMLALVMKYHHGQSRNKQRETPYWLHCAGVAALVEKAFSDSGVRIPESMYLAALGHDLYEDTTVEPALIKEQFGDDVHMLIQALTNERDDYNRTQYMQKLGSSTEEVRLIKLADMLENITSVANNLDVLGVGWLDDFFAPIMKDTIEILSKTTFTTYAHPAEKLIVARDLAMGMLTGVAEAYRT